MTARIYVGLVKDSREVDPTIETEDQINRGVHTMFYGQTRMRDEDRKKNLICRQTFPGIG